MEGLLQGLQDGDDGAAADPPTGDGAAVLPPKGSVPAASAPEAADQTADSAPRSDVTWGDHFVFGYNESSRLAYRVPVDKIKPSGEHPAKFQAYCHVNI